MKKFPLKEGDGPYKFSVKIQNQITNKVEDKSALFFVKAYGPENGKPNTFIISEHPKNTQIDVSIVTARIADRLRSTHGYNNTTNLNFFIHYPQNGRQNGPERFHEAVVRYSLNGPHLDHNSRDVPRERVASLIGEANMSRDYSVTSNPLVSKALSSGIADDNRPKTGQERVIDFD